MPGTPAAIHDRAYKCRQQIDTQNRGEGVDHRAVVGGIAAYPDDFHGHASQSAEEEKRENALAAGIRDRRRDSAGWDVFDRVLLREISRQGEGREGNQYIAGRANFYRSTKSEKLNQEQRKCRSGDRATNVGHVEIAE